MSTEVRTGSQGVMVQEACFAESLVERVLRRVYGFIFFCCSNNVELRGEGFENLRETCIGQIGLSDSIYMSWAFETFILKNAKNLGLSTQ